LTRNRRPTIGSRGGRTGRALLVAVGALSFAGCTDWAGYDLDYFWDAIPVLATMRGSVAYDPYELPRLPAPNSVPFSTPNGDMPGPFAQAQLDSAAATLTNPFAGSADPAVLARGQAVYNTQCTTCHGPQGAGNGPVVGPGKYPFAPPINGAATVGRSDGYIYAVMVAGRGLMPPYGEKITHADRWATVSYVRQLQGQSGGASAAPAAPGVTTAVNPPDSVPGGPALVDTTGQTQQQ
jgi:mono/diheme cytochrome c family protein